MRTCPDADCADGGAFAGSGLEGEAWFVDPATALEPGAALSLAGLPPAQLFHYLVRMESDAPGPSLGLASVTTTAEP